MVECCRMPGFAASNGTAGSRSMLATSWLLGGVGP